MYDSNNDAICSSPYYLRCTKDYEDTTWRNASFTFAHDVAYDETDNLHLITQGDFLPDFIRLNNSYNSLDLWTGAYFLDIPIKATIVDDGKLTATYSGTSHSGSGYPIFTITLIMDIKTLSRDYTIDFAMEWP
jgi:hypothetical protein